MGNDFKLSKSKFTAGCQCPKRLYLQYYQLEPVEVDEAQQAKFDQGHEVGTLATQAFANGVLVEEDYLNHQGAVAKTQELMSDKTIPAIFEAAFTFENVRVRVDILERRPRNRWRLIEVKSTASVKDYHYPDVAIQKYVLEGCGLKLSEACLMHLNRDYIYDGQAYDLEQLFVIEDLSEDISDYLDEIPGNLTELQEILALNEPPQVEPGGQCTTPFDCEFYGLCNPEVPEYYVGTLPRISKQKKQELLAQGIELIHDIPEDFGLTELQRRIYFCVKQGEPFWGKELVKELKGLRYPLYFMDFETYNPAIPRYVRMRPFGQIPFQWSVHVQRKPGGDLEHYEFLAHDADDPREGFISRLLDILEGGGGRGHIIVYNAKFEKGRLEDLANWLPQYASRIAKIQDRLWDLLLLVQRHVYHPKFHGSFSLKNVLPALIPHMSYEDMEIAEGAQAGLAYNAIVRGLLSDEEIQRIRNALLEYCKQDTLAMVELIQRLRIEARL